MPLLWLSLAFLTGLILADLTRAPMLAWGGTLAALLLLMLGARIFRHRFVSLRLPTAVQTRLQSLWQAWARLPVPGLLLLVFLSLGGGRYTLAQPTIDPGHVAWYIPYSEKENPRDSQPLVLLGVIERPPDERDRLTNLAVEVEKLRLPGETRFMPVKGRVLAKVDPGKTWRYGDWVRLEGVLQEPPEEEDFSYREYLRRQGIHAYLPEARAVLLLHNQGRPLLQGLYGLRDRAMQMVYRLYPDPEASLLAGILLGVEAGIPEQVQEAFKATGTSHIIAISGFNMAIIASLFASLFGRVLGRWRGAVAAVIAISLYTVLVGANAAVVRAAVMGGLAVFARQIGRRGDGINTLAFTAAVMSMFNPYLPWDVGFQLSFMATLGLVLYAGLFASLFTRLAARLLPEESAVRLSGPVGEFILFTFAAQLTTLPVMAYHFGRLSWISLVANPFILPAQPPVMILGGLAVIAGLVFQPLGQGLAYLAWPFVLYTIRVVEWFARLPAGEIVLGEVALLWIALYYGLLLGLSFGIPAFPRLKTLVPRGAVLTGLALMAVVAWRAVMGLPDERLHLAFLDVSGNGKSGEAALIETPGGRYVLVGGGPSVSRLSDGLGRRLPLGQRRLDWLVVGAASDAHIGALPRTLERFPAEQVLWAGPTHGTYQARLLQAKLVGDETPVVQAESGNVLDLGGGARLEVLTAGKRGAVLLVEWGSFRALLPVGLGVEDFESLQYGKAIGPVSVLLLAEQGYAPANPPEWIRSLSPQLVVLSVAADDGKGMPSAETMKVLEGYNVLRTDRNGWVEVSTDGEQMWVKAER